MIERRYVRLDGGDLHYRRAGNGPPVIVLHSSPMSSVAMVPWIEALTVAEMTVLALDIPGYGQSDPLADAEPSIDNYAQRVLAFADALGLDHFVIAGTHDGSKIALSVAIQAPDRVARLVMDGLDPHTADEMAPQLDHYTAPIVPQWHGGHLVETWHLVRAMFTFRPWYNQTPHDRLDESVPPLRDLHDMVFDMLRARPDWGLLTRAAFRYDGGAALTKLRVPAVLLAKEADPLHDHLGRLRAEAPALDVHGVANADYLADLVRAVQNGLDLAEAPPASTTCRHTGGTSRRYVGTSLGEVHVRMDGDPEAPPLLLVHDSPGSADCFDALISDLAADHLVIAPDTLGNGYSDAPIAGNPGIDHFAAAVAEVLDSLDVAAVEVYGTHTGACIGLELALARPDLVASFVADGLPAVDDALAAEIAENYWISMAPERNGEHLLRAWHTIRDSELWWPWYRDDASHRRPTAPPSPPELHRLVMEFVKSGSTYCSSYSAAFRYCAAERLARVQVPTLVCAAKTDMLRQASEQMAATLLAVDYVELDIDAGLDAAWAVRMQRGKIFGTAP